MPRAEAKYRITADDQTARGLRSAEGRLQRFGRQARRIGTILTAALTAGFVAFTRKLNEVQRELREVAKGAREVGETAEDFRELSEAIGFLGGDAGDARDVLDSLNDAIGDAITDPNIEKARLFTEVLGIDPRTLNSIESGTDRVIAFATALGRLEEVQGRPLREFVEQSIVGDNLSRFLDAESLTRELNRVRGIGILQGTDEAAEAATKAANAWKEAGLIWNKFFENPVFSRFSQSAGQTVSDALQFVRGGFRFPEQNRTQQSGVLVPQVVPDKLVNAANKQDRAATAIERAARSLERVVGRYTE